MAFSGFSILVFFVVSLSTANLARCLSSQYLMSSPAPNLPTELDFRILDSDYEDDGANDDSDANSYAPKSSSACLAGIVFDSDEENQDDSDRDVDYLPNSSSSSENNDECHSNESDLELTPTMNRTEPEMESEPATSDVKSRKRKRCPQKWKRNAAKAGREGGKPYTDMKGQCHKERVCNSTCSRCCTFKCGSNICEEDREKIFSRYWKLSDEKKLHFYAKFVEMHGAKRKRTQGNSVKKQSFTYYFEVAGIRIKVCREFNTSTLDINKARVYYFFKNNFNIQTGIAQTPTKGKHTKNSTPVDVVTGIENHIKSIPTVESHYCRATSSKLYLPQNLSITKMYEMYLVSDHVIENKPVKLSMYREIFNTKFNLSFHTPKKDRCDICEAYKQLKDPGEDEQIAFEVHTRKAIAGKAERDVDRAIYTKNRMGGDTLVLAFDMQNVFALPKAEISNFFYKRKFTCYNLTAHCNMDGVTYCAFWHEAISGRSGNHIASALLKILYAVYAEHPQLKKMILWSDSCVPQNRNSVMTTAIKHFLFDDNVNVQVIEQKYSEPGHGLIQEIDAVHSKIEKGLRRLEIFSPVGLLRNLIQLRPGKAPLKIIQLKSQDFMNFQLISSKFMYSLVPYTKVKHLIYDAAHPMHVGFRLNFNDELTNIRLARYSIPRENKKKSPQANLQDSDLFQKVSVLNVLVKLAPEKIKDLQSMYKFMPAIDSAFYKAIFKK